MFTHYKFTNSSQFEHQSCYDVANGLHRNGEILFGLGIIGQSAPNACTRRRENMKRFSGPSFRNSRVCHNLQRNKSMIWLVQNVVGTIIRQYIVMCVVLWSSPEEHDFTLKHTRTHEHTHIYKHTHTQADPIMRAQLHIRT